MPSYGQPVLPVLARPVAPVPGRRPLGDILADLSRQSRLPFSYSSSLIPVGRRYSLRPGPPRPLGAVLREVLAAAHLSYGLLDGQLVLWPDREAVPAGVTAVNGRAASIPSSAPRPTGYVSSHAGPPSGPPAAPGAPRRSAAGGRATASVPLGRAGGHAAGNPARPEARPTRTGAPPGATGSLASSRTSYRAGALRPKRTNGPSLGPRPAPAARPAGAGRGRGPGGGSIPAAASASAMRWPRALAGPGAPLRQQNQRPARAWAALPLRLVSLVADGSTAGGGPAAGSLVGPRPALGLAGQAADSLAAKRPDPAARKNPFYLHGEAWLSESLPIGGTAKVGVRRAYLVLGAASGPFGQHVGPAGGIGLGTAGRARGRFTPSLDVIQWFLSGDGDDGPRQTRLTQLRPLLAWQIKATGRACLLAGPTLNLATAPAARTGPRRWSFGQDQWRWLDAQSGQSVVRLWPGVQVGVRF